VSTHPYQREIEDLRSRLVAAHGRVAYLENENAVLRQQLYSEQLARANDMLARRNELNKQKSKGTT
jgi:hypothetical protein